MSVPLDDPAAILAALFTNPHVSLGDLVYQVRERAGGDWNDPAVTSWSQAVHAGEVYLKRRGIKP